MDESIQGVETTETVTPTADANPQASETNTALTETESPKEDTRDWQAYARKLEAENKDFKSGFKAKQVERVAETTAESQSPEQVEALALLRQVVDDAIAPIKSQFEAQQEEQILNKFSQDKYVQALGPEINTFLDKLPKYLENAPLQDRLDYARSKAIADNADKIASIHQQIGMDKAYENQSLKKSQKGLGQSKGQADDAPVSILDRVKDMSTKEYAEHYDEIQAAYKEQLGLK